MPNEELPYYSQDLAEVMEKLGTQGTGVTGAEAQERLEEYGPRPWSLLL